MQAGKLRQRVTLQTATEVADAYGEMIKAWADTATVWGAVEPLTGRELWLAQQADAVVTHKVALRYRSGVTPKMRVKLGTRYFDINGVLNIDERNRELTLYCTEVVL